MNTFSIIMFDGSILTIDKDVQLEAIKLKCEQEETDIEDFYELLKIKTKEYFDNKTLPTKFDWDESFEENIKSELYFKKCDVLHSKLRKNFEKKYGFSPDMIIGGDKLKETVEDEAQRLGGKVIFIDEEKGVGCYERFDNYPGKYYIIQRSKPMGKEYESQDNVDTTTALDWSDKEVKKPKYQEMIKEKFKDHAAVGDIVLYQFIRGPLLGLIFTRMSDQPDAKLVCLGDDKVSVYSKQGVVSVKKKEKDAD